MRRTSRRAAAFTVVEMVAVVVIMGLMAAAALPAFDVIQEARHAAATAELERVLITARARAMATARPTGVKVGTGGRELTMVEIVAENDPPTIVHDVFGQEMPAVDLTDRFAGVTVSTLTNGDGSQGPGIVWFNHEAHPHTRASDGAFKAFFAQDAEFTLSTGASVVVRRGTGAVTLP